MTVSFLTTLYDYDDMKNYDVDIGLNVIFVLALGIWTA